MLRGKVPAHGMNTRTRPQAAQLYWGRVWAAENATMRVFRGQGIPAVFPDGFFVFLFVVDQFDFHHLAWKLYRGRIDSIIFSVSADDFDEDDLPGVVDGHDQPEVVASDVEYDPIGADEVRATIQISNVLRTPPVGCSCLCVPRA